MPEETADTPDAKRERRREVKKLRERLAREREAWSRWMPRLKRAFHMIEKLDQRIGRLERLIARRASA